MIPNLAAGNQGLAAGNQALAAGNQALATAATRPWATGLDQLMTAPAASG